MGGNQTEEDIPQERNQLCKLSEESLTRQPEEVFDVLCKLGEGSYGSVFKALHKESGQVLAIKQVPVDTDLQEIIKEISIMQQCDSPYIVKYYGSYFKNSDLWIVMEYCGAGSVSDIMRLRKKTLSEDEIATVLSDVLKGLEYLHLRRKIHRDIKAGNILLNSEGHAKLADFGVAGQLTDTMAKRNTVIGTPFWMAPEVIEEMGYNCVADIWSLGITALEMAEGKPPYGDIHPMRAIFMIPTKPPPSFRQPDQWSPEFIDFVTGCLVKNPEQRATATSLLSHDFIRSAKPCSILSQMIMEAQEKRKTQQQGISRPDLQVPEASPQADEDEVDSDTMVRGRDDGTLVPSAGDTKSSLKGEFESAMHTMVINTDDEDEESTMKRYPTDDGNSKYCPPFLDRVGKSDLEVRSAEEFAKKQNVSHDVSQTKNVTQDVPAPTKKPPGNQEAQQPSQKVEPAVPPASKPNLSVQAPPPSPQIAMINHNLIANLKHIYNLPPLDNPPIRFQRPFSDGEFEFLKFLNLDDLETRLSKLDHEMEQEIDELRRRYQAKRQPILDAMDQKRKRQQNF
ncbi:unnamed protein product [Darwinula stevensoni]|uniref:non-specific serine/threonine protein kinase n=1 Tax=Darwinula stevensoni TaxID=69355 RepID=A0A7R8X7U2_9CRUS|nr:unnamed protein product [Darwinula stevensoni]CAG0883724.1 unnamed protein product [Darwinula stevensoni]